MRRFELHRDVDVSGVSGTGVVAEGVEFTDGSVAIRWHGGMPSTAVWSGLADAVAVHGHGGATHVEWLDEEPGAFEPCDSEKHSWDHFRPGQVDSYWMRCHRLGPHDEHENSETGAKWIDP